MSLAERHLGDRLQQDPPPPGPGQVDDRPERQVQDQEAVVGLPHGQPDVAQVLPAERQPERHGRDDHPHQRLHQPAPHAISSPAQDPPRILRAQPPEPVRAGPLLQRAKARLQPAAGLLGPMQVRGGDSVQPFAQEALGLFSRHPAVHPGQRSEVELVCATQPHHLLGPALAARTPGSAPGGRRAAGCPCAGAGRRDRAAPAGSTGRAPRPAPTGRSARCRAAWPGPRRGARKPSSSLFSALVWRAIGIPSPARRAATSVATRLAGRRVAAGQLGDGVRARGQLVAAERDEQARGVEGLLRRLAAVVHAPEHVVVKIDESHRGPGLLSRRGPRGDLRRTRAASPTPARRHTGCRGASPRATRSTSSTTRRDMAARVSAEPEPRCGVRTTFGRARKRAGHARLVAEHVQSGGGQPPLGERVRQRLVVDDLAPGRVDQHRAAPHERDPLPREQVLGGGSEWARSGTRSRSRRGAPGAARAALPGGPPGAGRRRGSACSNPAARRATAWPIRPKPTTPSTFPVTCTPSRNAGIDPGPAAGPDDPVALDHPARRRQEERHGMVGGGVGQDPGRVRHQHAPAAAGGQVDVVHAHPVGGDVSQVRGGIEERPRRRDPGTRRSPPGRRPPPRADASRPRPSATRRTSKARRQRGRVEPGKLAAPGPASASRVALLVRRADGSRRPRPRPPCEGRRSGTPRRATWRGR